MHREAKGMGDMVAYGLVKLARFVIFNVLLENHWYYIYGRAAFDLVSGYKHKPIPPDTALTIEELKKGGYILDEHAWLNVSVKRHY
jgi:ubiquinol oxidase